MNESPMGFVFLIHVMLFSVKLTAICINKQHVHGSKLILHQKNLGRCRETLNGFPYRKRTV